MPTDPRVEVITELRKQTALLEQIALALCTNAPRSATVPDSLLSGQYGDPVVKAKDPRDWTGEPMKGRKFSECPPEYLDMLAERYDYFASKETDQVKSGYAVKDAQRARGWAARLRAGWTAPTVDRIADESQTEPTW